MEKHELKQIIISKTKATKYFAKSMSSYKNEILKYGRTLSEGMYNIVNDIETAPLCEVCGEQPKRFVNYYKGYGRTCSRRCSSKLGGETHKNSYNPNTHKKAVATLKSKYGVDSPLKIPESRNKFKNTCLDRYGYDHFMKNPNSQIREQMRDTVRERYGVDYYFQTEQSRKNSSENIKIKHETNLFKRYFKNNHGVSNYYQTDDYFVKKLGPNPESMLDGRKLQEIAVDNNVSVYTLKRYIDVKGIDYQEPKDVSNCEISVRTFLDENNIQYVINDRTMISPYELDIYIPQSNVAIEVNGIYWHSDIYKSNNYHQKKFQRAQERGITLIQFTDLDWYNKPEKWKSVILSKTGRQQIRAYARKTKIDGVDGKQAKAFCDQYHIQGHTNASEYIGLFDKNDLVALMSFSKSRYNRKYDWELVRFCSDGHVVGGFSKLLNHFIKKNGGSIVSYSNNNLSTGNVYKVNGFRYVGYTTPSYVWSNSRNVLSRYQVQKSKLGYIESEIQYMRNLGYYRYFDAGSQIWVINEKTD